MWDIADMSNNIKACSILQNMVLKYRRTTISVSRAVRFQVEGSQLQNPTYVVNIVFLPSEDAKEAYFCI